MSCQDALRTEEPPPLSRSHDSPPKPSPLLALLALAVVHRLRPAWVGIEVGEAARAEGHSPERISRLCTAALTPFEQVLATLTHVGRPPRDRAVASGASELVLTRALLQIATAILAHVPLRRAGVRDLVVGAWRRLDAEHHVTQERFCAALALPARTLRAWLARAPAPSSAPPTGPPVAPTVAPGAPRPRPPRRRRFGFDVTLPDTQIAADTTDVSAFGVGLKLVAAQDVGGRDQDLLDSVLVDDRESADHVVRVMTAALTELPGAQAITDQGTPYMAAATRDALDALGVEHAPQKEADPCGKSTVERAFETCKSVLRPLLALTDRLAAAVPALRDGALAKAIVTVLVTAMLRAYQAGARAATRAIDARGGLDAETLARAAREHREQARAEETSARLLLRHVHELYGITRPLRSFVDSLRRYHPEVLLAAERDFRRQVHRDDIRDRASYFAAIVRRENEDRRREIRRQRRLREQSERLDQQVANGDARRAGWLADPAAWLRDGLGALTAQWRPSTGTLLFGGAGPASAWVRGALERLVELHGPVAAADIARGVQHAFRLANLDRLGPDVLDAIATVLDRHLVSLPTPRTTAPCAPAAPSAILGRTGKNQRPPPPDRLRT